MVKQKKNQFHCVLTKFQSLLFLLILLTSTTEKRQYGCHDFTIFVTVFPFLSRLCHGNHGMSLASLWVAKGLMSYITVYMHTRHLIMLLNILFFLNLYNKTNVENMVFIFSSDLWKSFKIKFYDFFNNFCHKKRLF